MRIFRIFFQENEKGDFPSMNGLKVDISFYLLPKWNDYVTLDLIRQLRNFISGAVRRNRMNDQVTSDSAPDQDGESHNSSQGQKRSKQKNTPTEGHFGGREAGPMRLTFHQNRPRIDDSGPMECAIRRCGKRQKNVHKQMAAGAVVFFGCRLTTPRVPVQLLKRLK